MAMTLGSASQDRRGGGAVGTLSGKTSLQKPPVGTVLFRNEDLIQLARRNEDRDM